MNKKRIIATTLLCIILLSTMSIVAFAGNSALDTIRGSNSAEDGGDMVTAIDGAMNNVISTVRIVAVLGAAGMIIFIGISMLFSGASQNIAAYKTQAVMLVVALLLIFKTEEIVGTLLGFFGAEF